MHPSTAPLRTPHRQRGAVALMFGLTLVVLLGVGGLVLDLGHLYVVKSELQNGADSAALAGAKEINLSAAGINAAAAKAITFSQRNKFNFSSDLTINNSNIAFGSTPDGPWFSVGEAAASPAGKTFIKVDTGTKTVSTYLMGVAGIPTIATSGVAVAGRFVVDITPLGLCALNATRFTARPTTPAAPAVAQSELVEFGFRRGVTYDMLKLAEVAGPADPMLLNAVDSPPTACSASHSSANFTAPFLCQGNSAVANNATEVYANTGVSAGPVEKALNSRFNQFGGGSPCLPATAPPDINVRPYDFDDASFGAASWMNTIQARQSQVITAGIPADPMGGINQVGVLWTYSRPVRAVGSAGAYTPGAAFDTADWDELYFAGLDATAAYPTGANPSPYAQTSAPYFLAPTINPGAPNRRLMNMAIVDCDGVGSGAMSCKKLPILGVGRFFLQRPAALTGSSKGIFVEFAGLISPVPNSEIKLYR